MSLSSAAESRQFYASLLMLVIVVGLLCYLTFIPVPDGNKDIIITVLGVLLGGASAALPNLFGSRDGETERLKTELADLRHDYDKLDIAFATLKQEHDKIVHMLVDKLPVAGGTGRYNEELEPM